MSDKYYVIGYPVKHSLSPEIHMKFAKQTRQDLEYEVLEVCPDNLQQTLNVLRLDKKVKGLSITVPFKERLYEYCDTLDSLAQQAQAVSNVIIDENRQFKGLNLDGLGLVNDLKHNMHVSLKDKKILTLGAGGAAKGIVGAILQQQPKAITIANRTYQKALNLAQINANSAIEVKAIELSNITASFDVVINATSASINGAFLPVAKENFNQDAIAYDLMYGTGGTVFTKWCQENYIKTSDGKGMLLELSKLAFEHWRGVLPKDIVI